MAKDPAFLFYSQDFYTGVATLNWEDRGKFISILCLMHQQGRMHEETIRFLVGSISVNLKSKFRIDENGLWFNARLEAEAAKRNGFTESRRLNGVKGGRPKKSSKKHKPTSKHMQNHMDNHMGNGDEDVNDNKINKESDLIFPFESVQFKEAWLKWKLYKKDEHKFRYKSSISEQGALKDISELSKGNEEVAIQIIYQSISKGWKGFFELKQDHGNTKTKRETPQDLAIAFADRVVRRSNGEELQSGW